MKRKKFKKLLRKIEATDFSGNQFDVLIRLLERKEDELHETISASPVSDDANSSFEIAVGNGEDIVTEDTVYVEWYWSDGKLEMRMTGSDNDNP